MIKPNINTTRVLETVNKEEFEKDYKELSRQELLEKYKITFNNMYAILKAWNIEQISQRKRKEKVVIDIRERKKLSYIKPELDIELVNKIRNTDTEIARYIWSTIKEFYE